MISYCKAEHDLLYQGKKKAIAWGCSADAIFKIARAPYQFEFLIDGTAENTDCHQKSISGVPVVSSNILKSMSDKQFTIVVFADLASYYLDICEQVALFGDFKVISPYCPWRQNGVKQTLKSMNSEFGSLAKTRQAKGKNQYEPLETAVLWLYKLVRGGAEKQTVMLAKALSEQGVRVTLITAIPDAANVADWTEILNSLKVERVTISAIRANIQTQFAHSPALVKKLLTSFNPFATYHMIATSEILNAKKPDLLVSYMIDGAMIASMAGLIAGVPQINFSVRNVAPISQSQDEFCYANYAVAKNAIPSLFKFLLSFPRVTMTSNSLAGKESFLSWMGGSAEQIKVVPNGFEQPLLSNHYLRQDYALSDHTPVVIGVMRLVEQKRPELFLSVVYILSKEISNLKVFLVGDGPLFSDLAALIKERGMQNIVTLVGHYPSPLDYCYMADVLLHTAQYEGFPNVLLEALSVDCPVVATDAGGSAEVIPPSLRTLSIIESDSPNDIAKRVIEVMKQENRQKFRGVGQQLQRDFSLPQLAIRTAEANDLSLA